LLKEDGENNPGRALYFRPSGWHLPSLGLLCKISFLLSLCLKSFFWLPGKVHGKEPVNGCKLPLCLELPGFLFSQITLAFYQFVKNFGKHPIYFPMPSSSVSCISFFIFICNSEFSHLMKIAILPENFF
jgi:hypothetical protein